MVKINSQKEVGLQSNRVCANGEGGSLFKLKTFAVIAILVASSQGCCQSTGAVNGVKYFNLSVQTAAGDLHCLIDKEPVEVTMSSDGDAVIVSGTDYVPVDELIRCKADVPVRVRRAAPPRVGFLSDINIKSGICASMIPVAVSPLSFVVVVGKIGNDRNLVKIPVFYRSGVGKSKLKAEASSDVVPVISLDGRYISLKWHRCEEDFAISVVEIKRGGSKSIASRAKDCSTGIDDLRKCERSSRNINCMLVGKSKCDRWHNNLDCQMNQSGWRGR